MERHHSDILVLQYQNDITLISLWYHFGITIPEFLFKGYITFGNNKGCCNKLYSFLHENFEVLLGIREHIEALIPIFLPVLHL